MNTINLTIKSNESYEESSVETQMTVGELKAMLENFNDDDVIVTKDLNNQFGASFGSIVEVN